VGQKAYSVLAQCHHLKINQFIPSPITANSVCSDFICLTKLFSIHNINYILFPSENNLSEKSIGQYLCNPNMTRTTQNKY
jgi:hypothetical protein